MVTKKSCHLWLLIGLFCLGTQHVVAVAKYWDTDGGTPGTGATPSGTWDGVTSNWTTDTTGASATTTFANNDDAFFAAGTTANTNYIVTLSGTQIANSVNLEADGGADVTIQGGTALQLGVGNTPFDVASGRTLTIGSAITGGGNGLSKASAGDLILSGTNSYIGATNVTVGTLFVGSGGSLSNASTVTVSANAVLGGEGSIAGSMNMSTNAIVSPGDLKNDIGSLALDGTNDFTNGIYYFEVSDATLGTAGTDYDLITSTSNIDFSALSGNNLTIQIRNKTAGFFNSLEGLTAFVNSPNWGTGAGDLEIMRSSGTMSNFNASYFTLDSDILNINWEIKQNGNSLWLSYAAVPEPSTYVLGFGLLAFLFYRIIRKIVSI